VSLPETLRPVLRSTANATVYGAQGSGVAVLRQLSDAADPLTRTFEAKYVLQGAAANAPLGATVTISLPDARPTTGQQIPLGALYDGGQGPGLWLVDPRTSAVSWRPVTVSSLGEESAVVTGGLAAGERFVSLGAHLLHAGEVVRASQAGATQ
jgi:multidrug efflux pump subunit AcrA (membrane-fusion protein)